MTALVFKVALFLRRARELAGALARRGENRHRGTEEVIRGGQREGSEGAARGQRGGGGRRARRWTDDMVPAQQGPESAKPGVGIGVGLGLTETILRYRVRLRANLLSG